MQRDDQDPQDWWTQNAPPATPPPAATGDGAWHRNPDGSVTGPDGTIYPVDSPQALGLPDQGIPGATGDVINPPAPAPGPENLGGGGAPPPPAATPPPIGMPTEGFGAPPPPYVSDPNAPVYEPLPAYVPPQWTGGDYVPPTEEQLFASPGYKARLDTLLQGGARRFASQGTILNGGTVKALDRSAQDYATGEYQTLNANMYDQYKTRYAQFADAAGRDLASRSVNAADAATTFANRTSTYLNGNARTLSDYLANLTAQRNSQLDYWSRLMDLNQTGANLAGGSR